MTCISLEHVRDRCGTIVYVWGNASVVIKVGLLLLMVLLMLFLLLLLLLIKMSTRCVRFDVVAAIHIFSLIGGYVDYQYVTMS